MWMCVFECVHLCVCNVNAHETAMNQTNRTEMTLLFFSFVSVSTQMTQDHAYHMEILHTSPGNQQSNAGFLTLDVLLPSQRQFMPLGEKYLLQRFKGSVKISQNNTIARNIDESIEFQN